MTDACLIGTETDVTLVGNDGTRFDLMSTTAPYTLADGSTFRGMSEWNISTRVPGPEAPGEQIDNIRAAAKTFAVPVIIHGSTEIERDAAVAAIAKVLSPQVGPCRIVYTRADQTKREITASYVGGANNLQVENLSIGRYAVAQLVFRAHFPFWRQVDSSQGTDTGTFTNGYYAGSDELNIDNIGDVRTWPEWVISGPAENIQLANLTTGQLLRIIEVLSDTQSIRIVTNPTSRGVYLDDDLDWSVVDSITAEMWPLVPGTNRVILRATYPPDAATGGTWSTSWPILWETC